MAGINTSAHNHGFIATQGNGRDGRKLGQSLEPA